MAGAGAASVLMMVAIIGIIAAIAIPSLLRARVSANEAATIGNLRTMVSAQAAYASAAGSYGLPECLASPARPGCIEGYPAGEPAFLEPELASASTRSGYRWSFVQRLAPSPLAATPTGSRTFCYGATPITAGQTGVRSFAADQTGTDLLRRRRRRISARGARCRTTARHSGSRAAVKRAS